MFFIFGGFHIAFCVYMLVGIPSTGSGGLINCIAAFASGSIVTGVFCAIATVCVSARFSCHWAKRRGSETTHSGWGLQTLGMLFEYRSVRRYFLGLTAYLLSEPRTDLQSSQRERAYFPAGALLCRP